MFSGRSSNFRGRGGGRNNKTRSQAKGVFADGIWHCDCTPRLPAEHFRVKKDGPNHGRYFYVCQQSEDKRCGFFLWEDDAKPREEAAVLSGRRTEPGVQEGWSAGRTTDASSGGASHNPGPLERLEQPDSHFWNQQSAYNMVPPPTLGTKRSAKNAQLDDDENDGSFAPWGLTTDDEERLARAADPTVPMTPQKVPRIDTYPTPATTGKRRLPWTEQQLDSVSIKKEPQDDHVYSTPSKAPATASSATISHNIAPQTPNAIPNMESASTPYPPTRHRNALTNPADDASSLTSEVLASLSTIQIPPATLSNVRSILTKHDLKTQGFKKGRDISRLALQAKDAKIAELQARIASLEADRELERAMGRAERRESRGQSRVEN